MMHPSPLISIILSCLNSALLGAIIVYLLTWRKPRPGELAIRLLGSLRSGVGWRRGCDCVNNDGFIVDFRRYGEQMADVFLVYSKVRGDVSRGASITHFLTDNERCLLNEATIELFDRLLREESFIRLEGKKVDA